MTAADAEAMLVVGVMAGVRRTGGRRRLRFWKNVRTKRTKPAGRGVMEIMPGKARPACRVCKDIAVLSAEGSRAMVVRGSDGMAVKWMVTVFGSRLCAFSVAGDEDFEEFGLAWTDEK
jgi:hypothetical protein